VAFAWAGVVVVVYSLLRAGKMPAMLPILTTLADTILVTTVVTISGGPKSTALVLLYLLIIAATPLRLSLRLVYFATFAAAIGYIIALGHYVFLRIGEAVYYNTESVRIPRSQEVVTLLAILSAGLLAGQAVRQTIRLTANPSKEASP
jgi:hypothetical protein